MAEEQATSEAVDAELAARLEAAYDADGLDRSLVRASLAMTPTERIVELESFLNALATARPVDPPR